MILDTNVFVAAGFNRDSASARIVEAVRAGSIPMIWNDATIGETRHIVTRIPPLSWEEISELFRKEHRFSGATDPAYFSYVLDPDDRKFAALAAASGAILVTSDSDLLSVRGRLPFRVVTPSEYVSEHRSLRWSPGPVPLAQDYRSSTLHFERIGMPDVSHPSSRSHAATLPFELLTRLYRFGCSTNSSRGPGL